MTNSHWLGFITFGVSALFASLALIVSKTHPEVSGNMAKKRRTERVALFLLGFGIVFGYVAFTIDYRMRTVTLHEVMVEGNGNAQAGAPAPVRVVAFTVEHPGVSHALSLSPTAELFQPPAYAVDVAFSLRGPNGQSLLPEQTETFSVREETRRSHADWEGKSFSFTPIVAGPHTVQVKPLTRGIPRIQVRIEDPMKRNGERMSGY